MKKLIPITLCALLVAGSLSLLLADATWFSGSASGECGGAGIKVFQPWIGQLVTSGSSGYFDGYWGGAGKYDNDMDADGIENIGLDQWTVDSADGDGYWDADDEESDYVGSWDGHFHKSTNTGNGRWWGTNVACDGNWWDNN